MHLVAQSAPHPSKPALEIACTYAAPRLTVSADRRLKVLDGWVLKLDKDAGFTVTIESITDTVSHKRARGDDA